MLIDVKLMIFISFFYEVYYFFTSMEVLQFKEPGNVMCLNLKSGLLVSNVFVLMCRNGLFKLITFMQVWKFCCILISRFLNYEYCAAILLYKFAGTNFRDLTSFAKLKCT